MSILRLLMLACIGSILFHSIAPRGLVNDRHAVRSTLARDGLRARIGSIDPESLRHVPRQRIVIIDSRPRSAFDSGHLPGAISLPAGSDRVTRAHLLRDVAARSRLVVYCSDRNCAIDEFLAIQLLEDGWNDVSLLEGGIDAWIGRGYELVTTVHDPSSKPSSSTRPSSKDTR
jgi:rhodanese-related sulfurtransferase